MPTVPVIDQTAMPDARYSASGAAPMPNAAPDQIQRMGQAVQQAGSLAFRTGQTVGDQLAAQVDDAQVQSAVTSSLSSADKLLRDPQNGFLNKFGQDAISSYQPTQQAIQKVYQSGLDGMSNPIQQRMYREQMQNRMLSLGDEIADHNATQSRAYAAGAAKSAADSYMRSALQNSDARGLTDAAGNPTGMYVANQQWMQAQVLKAAQVAGLNPDSPQAKQLVQDQNSQLNALVIHKLLVAHDPDAARKMFDEENANGNISSNAFDALDGAIKAETDRQATERGVQEYATKAITGGKMPVSLAPILATGEASFAGTSGEDNGLLYAAPANSKVMAPSDGKVTGILDGDKGSVAVQIQFANGSTAMLGGLAATAVKPGDMVKSGSMVGVSNGTAVYYTLQTADGNYVDPRSASEAQPDMSAMANPDIWQKATALAQDGPEAPQIKKRIISGLEALHGDQAGMQNQEAEQRYKTALGQFYNYANQHNGNFSVQAIDSDLFHSLTPEQQYNLSNIVTEHQKMLASTYDPEKTQANIDARFYIATHPYMNMQDLTALGTSLTPNQMIEAAKSITTRDPQKAAIDVGQMKTALDQAGLQDLYDTRGQNDDQKMASQQRYNAINDDVQKIFNDAQAAKKAPLTSDERQTLLQDYLINNVVTVHDPHWYQSSSNHTSDYQVDYPNLSPQQRAKAFIQTGDGKPAIPLSQVKPEDWDAAVNALIRHNASVPPAQRQALTAVNIGKVLRAQKGAQ